MTKTGVAFVVPVYNEEAALPKLIERCIAVGSGLGRDFDLILVDDGSSDDSAGLIRAAAEAHPGIVSGVLLNRNYGQHAAVLAGLAASRAETVVTLDADLQNPPEEIPKLLDLIDGGHDVVGGVRRIRRDSVFRRTASRLMNRIMRRLTGVAITDYGCMLRAYRRDIVDAILRCEDRSAYIPALGNGFAGHPAEVVVEHAERGTGESKYNVWSLVNLYFDLLVSTSTAPLRLLSLIGIAMAIVGVAFGVLLLVLRFVYGPDWSAEGVFTIFALLFVFLGVQFVGMGLLGEYLGRISKDVQARPRYLVAETIREPASRKSGAAAGAPPGAATPDSDDLFGAA